MTESKGDGIFILHIFGDYLLVDMPKHSKRLKFSTVPLWGPKVSHCRRFPQLLQEYFLPRHQFRHVRNTKNPLQILGCSLPQVLRSVAWLAEGKRRCHWANPPVCPSIQPAAENRSRNSVPRHLKHVHSIRQGSD